MIYGLIHCSYGEKKKVLGLIAALQYFVTPPALTYFLFFYFKPFPMNRLSVPFWADLELLLVVPGHGRMQLKLLIVLSFQSEPTHKQHLKGSVNNFSYSVNFQHFVTFNHTATIQDPIQFSDKECFWLDNFLIYINNNNYNNGSNIIIINN